MKFIDVLKEISTGSLKVYCQKSCKKNTIRYSKQLNDITTDRARNFVLTFTDLTTEWEPVEIKE